MSTRASDAAASATRIVHDIPGRLRFRLSTAVDAASIAEGIQQLEGVRSCTWSPLTRSLLVSYEPRQTTAAAIAHAVPDVATRDDVEMAQTSPANNGAAPPGEASARELTPLTVAKAVTGAVGALDARVRNATGGIAGLGTLLPLALVVWAAREVLQGRAGPLRWSSALWYAHGLFRDYGDH